MSEGPSEIGPAAVGLQADCLGEVDDGAIAVAEFVVRITALDVRSGIVRRQADDLAEVGDRRHEVLVRMCDSPRLKTGAASVGSSLRGLGEIRDGLLVPFQFRQRHAAQIERADMLGIELQDPGEIGDGFFILPLLGPESARSQNASGLSGASRSAVVRSPMASSARPSISSESPR